MKKRMHLGTLSLEQGEFIPMQRDYESFYKELDEGQTVCGKVIKFDPVEENLYVQLSNTVYGILPYEEATIYQLGKFEPGKAPKQIATLLGKTIHCKILYISLEEETIMLSRKENMINALQLIKENFEQNPDDVYEAMAISLHQNLNYIFEMCEGIRVRCHVTEISAVKIQLTVKDEESCREKLNKWFEYGQKVKIKILGLHESGHSFKVSVKLADTRNYEYYLRRKYFFQWKRGEKLIPIKVKIAEPVIEKGKITGYYCEVSPSVRGIVDVPENITLEFGSIVDTKLKKIILPERKIYLDLA